MRDTAAPDPLDLWNRIVRRRWRTGLAIAGFVTLVGAAVLLLSRPIHRAEASLRLGEPPPPGGIAPAGGVFSFLQLGGDPFANDLELLASRSLAEGVVDAHALAVTLDAPRGWYRDSLATSLAASRATDEASFEVRWLADGRVSVRQVAPRDSVVATAAPGAPVRFGGVTAAFRPYRAGMPEAVGVSTVPFAEAVRTLRGSLAVERPRREANVVTLAWDHPDPPLARAVVATTIGEFVRLRTDLQQRESGETVDSLRGVSRRTADELRRAENELERLQRVDRIVAPDAQIEALVARQTELLSRLQRARGELAGIDEALRRLETVADPARAWTALLSYPAFLENETLGQLLSRITELHAQREAVVARRSAASTDVRVLDEQIVYLDASLRQVAREYRTGLIEQIVVVEPELAGLDRRLGDLPARALELARRQRDVRLLSEVFVMTEQRLRQEELRDALTYANIQVIDPPALRDRPVWPRKRLGLAVVLLLGGAAGVLGMAVRERTDPRLRSVGDVEAVLGAPVLTVLASDGDGPVAPVVAEALLRRIEGEGTGPARLLLVRAGGGERGERAALELATAAGNGSGPPRIRYTGPGPDGVASNETTAALVVEVGRTTADEVRRARRSVGEAGAHVVGAVLVARDAAEADRVWG